MPRRERQKNLFVSALGWQQEAVNVSAKSPFRAAVKSFWRKWGVAGFCGIVFGIGWNASKHLSWPGRALVFGALCGLLGALLHATRHKKNGEQA